MAFGRVGSLGTGFAHLGALPGGVNAVGGAALLAGEANGFAADFTHPVDAQRGAVKTNGTVAYSGLSFFTKSGSVKWVYDATGTLVSVGATVLAIDYDPVTHVSRGLMIEVPATNLLLNNATLGTQSVTVTAVQHTLSIFGTGTVTLTGTSTAGPLVGTGANNRVSLTFTPTAGSLTCTVSGSVTKGQLEIGSIASSPIPTAGSAVTRTGDVISCTAASINYSATAGNWFTDLTVNQFVNSTTPRIITQNGGNTPIFIGSTNQFGFFDGAILYTVVGSTLGSHKLAAAFQSGDRAITSDGQAPVLDVTAGSGLLAPVTIGIGANPGNTDHTSIYLRKLRYLPRRPTNAQLTAMTV